MFRGDRHIIYISFDSQLNHYFTSISPIRYEQLLFKKMPSLREPFNVCIHRGFAHWPQMRVSLTESSARQLSPASAVIAPASYPFTAAITYLCVHHIKMNSFSSAIFVGICHAAAVTEFAPLWTISNLISGHMG
jgi:hypothetical protein